MFIQMIEMSEECDSVKDLPITEAGIVKLRGEYRDNCVGLADAVAEALFSKGIVASVLIFKTVSPFLKPLVVYDELQDCEIECTHHAVVLSGTRVTDLLYSDRIVGLREYMDMLKERNEAELKLDSRSTLYDYEYNIPVSVTTMRQLDVYLEKAEKFDS